MIKDRQASIMMINGEKQSRRSWVSSEISSALLSSSSEKGLSLESADWPTRRCSDSILRSEGGGSSWVQEKWSSETSWTNIACQKWASWLCSWRVHIRHRSRPKDWIDADDLAFDRFNLIHLAESINGSKNIKYRYWRTRSWRIIKCVDYYTLYR